MTSEIEKTLIEKIKNSNIQHFPDLAELLIKSRNLNVDLIKFGYKGKCSRAINSALRDQRVHSLNNNELLLEISKIIDDALENNFQRYNAKTVWRHEWPTTSTEAEDLKVYYWFKDNIGKVLLFPSFLSSYSEEKRLPYKKRYFEITTHFEESFAFDISNLCINDPEAEILFKTGTKLKIVDVDEHHLSVKFTETKEKEDFKVTNGSVFHCQSILK